MSNSNQAAFLAAVRAQNETKSTPAPVDPTRIQRDVFGREIGQWQGRVGK